MARDRNPAKGKPLLQQPVTQGAPSENDLRQPCSFLGLCSMGNPRLRSAAEENGGGSPMLRRPQKTRGESMLEEGAPCVTGCQWTTDGFIRIFIF
ncbi:MAG: hypothetical protein C4B57_09560 [Deltaproteobacteria bacterium]|nr:MAG: hypothetical protein C4B57_09560 [Deltaproteobacteria bacterium]